jgi:hypothetical protein
MRATKGDDLIAPIVSKVNVVSEVATAAPGAMETPARSQVRPLFSAAGPCNVGPGA